MLNVVKHIINFKQQILHLVQNDNMGDNGLLQEALTTIVMHRQEDLPMHVNLNIIKEIVESKPPTSVKPREFFIAWQGVPTLAYEGFSAILLKIKKEISDAVPGLRKENPGSLWPKTTLGALKDNIFLSFEDRLLSLLSIL